MINIYNNTMKKDKGDKVKNQRVPAKVTRLHTQSQALVKNEKVKRVSAEGPNLYLQTELDAPDKLRISTKELLKEICYIKDQLEKQLDILLAKDKRKVEEGNQSKSTQIWKMHERLLQIRMFRIREVGQGQLLEEYGRLIQAAELLFSKLHNSERVKDYLYFGGQEDLILFFKHLFGKPYSLCNLPHFRKVLAAIWDRYHLPNTKAATMLEELRIWAHGIQLPLNPASVYLQKRVFSSPNTLKLDAGAQNNMACYSNIEAADCLGLNPLLLAVHCNINEAYQPAIKIGANFFQCPITSIKGLKSIQINKNSKKNGSVTNIKIHYPIPYRHQFNCIEVLMLHRQYQQIVNLITYQQVTKVKELKKNRATLYERLCQIPDLCCQIHWKAVSTSLLSFKNLPRDVVVIYKKQGSLRIDFRIDDLQKPTPNGSFSILLKTFKTEDQKLQYYLISHHDKKIYDLTREVDSQKVKLRYEQITQFGNIEDQTLISLDANITRKYGQYKQKQNQKERQKHQKLVTEFRGQFLYENVKQAQLYGFKSVKQYEKQLYTSQMIDYKAIEHSQVQALLENKIGSLPKVKSKQLKSTMSIGIEWVKERIGLKDIVDIINILDKKSVLFIKVLGILKAVMKEKEFRENGQLGNWLPLKTTMDSSGRDFRLQVELKNLMYCNLDEAVFGLEYRTKTQQYEEQQAGLESLQETMIMDENYSIEISQFLGKTQQLLIRESEENNRKFDELLTREMEENQEEQSGVGGKDIIPAYLLD